MRILDVTRDDIAQGKRRDPEACPVAHSARRALLRDGTACTTERVWVGATRITHRVYRYDWHYAIPPEVAAWIQDFDEHGTAEPMRIELGQPTPEDRMGGGWDRR